MTLSSEIKFCFVKMSIKKLNFALSLSIFCVLFTLQGEVRLLGILPPLDPVSLYSGVPLGQIDNIVQPARNA